MSFLDGVDVTNTLLLYDFFIFSMYSICWDLTKQHIYHTQICCCIKGFLFLWKYCLKLISFDLLLKAILGKTFLFHFSQYPLYLPWKLLFRKFVCYNLKSLLYDCLDFYYCCCSWGLFSISLGGYFEASTCFWRLGLVSGRSIFFIEKFYSFIIFSICETAVFRILEQQWKFYIKSGNLYPNIFFLFSVAWIPISICFYFPMV